MLKVKLPQEDGEVVVSSGAGVHLRVAVTDHMAEIEDQDLAALLEAVPGATVEERTDSKSADTEPATTAPTSKPDGLSSK